MTKIYKILWVDDEHDDEALLPFIVQAEAQGIILEGYGSFKEGFYALESNINNYDVILLDALFFEDETSETPNPAGLGSAIQKINELKNKKSFPYFVLSGQTHFTDVTNPILEAFKIRCYNKKNPDDVKELLVNIKSEADNQLDFQIRHEYNRVFEVGNDNYLGSKINEPLINLLKQVKETNDFEPTKDSLLPLRKIIESSFDRLFELGLIPEEIYRAGLNPTVKFLCNNKNISGYTVIKEFMHPSMSYLFDNLVFITQDSQHDKKGLKLNVDEYISNIKSPYLFKSLVFQLLDYLIWLKQFIDENPNPDVNTDLWTKENIVEVSIPESDLIGQLQQDDNKNYHLGKFIFPYRTIDGNYYIGDKLEITKSIENTQLTKDKYPFFVTNFKKI